MPENRYVRYLVDPRYEEDYGVSPPPSRLILVGAAAGAALLFLRTPAGHRLLHRLAPRAQGRTLLERRLTELYYARRSLMATLQSAFKDEEIRNRLLEGHLHTLRQETIEALNRKGHTLTGRLLGLRPVTVEDVLEGRVDVSFQPFRLLRATLRIDPDHPIDYLENVHPIIMEGWIRRMARRYPEILRAPVDPGLLMDASGRVVDIRGFQQLIDRLTARLSDISIPIVNWNLGQLLRLELRREIAERPSFAHIPKGSLQPFFGGPVKEDLLLLGRKLVSLSDPNRVIAEGVYIAPFGTPLRAAALIQEISKPTTGYKYRTKLHELLDIGQQPERSWIESILSIFRKKHRLDVRSLAQELLEGEQKQGAARRLLDAIMAEPMPLSRELMESPEMRQAIRRAYGSLFPEGRVPLETESDLLSALFRLLESGKVSRRYGRVLKAEWERIARISPEAYFRHLHFTRERFPQLPYLSLEQVVAIPQAQRLRLLLQLEMRHFIRERLGAAPFDELSKEALKSPALRRMLIVERLRSARSLDELEALVDASSPEGRLFRQMVQRTVREMAPWYTPSFDPRSPSKRLAEQARGGLLMREWFRLPSISDIWDALTGDQEAAQRVWRQTGRFARQFFAGRHDREHFTTASLIPYHLMSRLNDMFAAFGLGLSERHLGSAHQIFFNLLFRRYLAAIALFGYAGYLSWEIENFTGFSPKRAFFDALAGLNIAWAGLMNATGITTLTRRMTEVMPGSELFWELPVLSFFDPRWEAEELAEFLREGTAPVRKGRWWQFSGPIQGGPILYYWPSWYRRFTADWEFTPILWGEREEAYAHWWLPTPRFPAAPIRAFITEPYHLEQMWGRHRPYPVTGPIPAFDNIPVLGPLLNATVGRLLKPPVRMYEEEMAAWAAGQVYGPQVVSPLTGAVPVVQVTPAGLVRLGLQAQVGVEPAAGEAETPPAEPGQPRPFGPAFLAALNQLAGLHEATMAEAEARGVEQAIAPLAYLATPATGRDEQLPVATEAVRGPALLTALRQLARIHQGILAEDEIRTVTLRSRRPIDLAMSLPPDITVPGGDALRFQLAESFSQATDIMGIYGFLLRSVLGMGERPWEEWPRLATPARVTSLGRWHADLQIGGFPGELSEVGRRFLPAYRRYDPEVEINPIRNLMPSWMPGSNYFINFKEGDPYVKIPHGEYRLPGPGYERMHGIPPLEERLAAMFPDPQVRSVVKDMIDRGFISPYETYSAWERFKILADVAPWSEEYKYYEKLLTDNKELIPPTKLDQFQKIKKQVSQVKKRERFFPYRFRYSQLEYHTVTVSRVINNNVFLVEEFDRPIRLAGVYVPQGQNEAGQRAREALSRFIYPGARITIGIAQDPLRRTGSDQLESIRAVVLVGGMQLNRWLIEQGIAKERPAEDPASVHVRFSSTEIAIGSLWEWFAHLDTPFHTLLLQVRSPLEMYERKEIFGKAWRPWHEPVSSILIPTLESLARHSPLVAAGYGYVYGSLATLMSRDEVFKRRARLWGAGILAGLSAIRMLYEATTGETWIPPRRRIEREVEMYFSALEYLKYRGIYEFARRRALEEEGFDVEQLYQEAGEQGRRVRRLRRELRELKRELITQGTGIPEDRLAEIHARIQMLSETPVEPEHEAMIRAINERLRELGELRREEELGPWAQLAIQARERYESTIWGMDPYGHLEHIIRALPRKDRVYITEFLEAPEPERERILQIAPIYVRRVLQARWGMDVEPLPDLAEFFSQYWLPPIESGVWSPAKNLEDLKVKVVESLGLELTEFGLWGSDVRRAERHEAPILPWKDPNAHGADLERQLRAIMEGQGLENVWIRISPSEQAGIRMLLRIQRDPTEEMRQFLLNNPYAVFGR